MPECPECGHKWNQGIVNYNERKVTIKKVPKGKAIGCLYCFDCEKFGWGKNKCHWCGSTKIALYSGSCPVEEYKRKETTSLRKPNW